MHYCTRPSCNSASGCPQHLGVIVLTKLQIGRKRIMNYVNSANNYLQQLLFFNQLKLKCYCFNVMFFRPEVLCRKQ